MRDSGPPRAYRALARREARTEITCTLTGPYPAWDVLVHHVQEGPPRGPFCHVGKHLPSMVPGPYPVSFHHHGFPPSPVLKPTIHGPLPCARPSGPACLIEGLVGPPPATTDGPLHDALPRRRGPEQDGRMATSSVSSAP